MLLLPVCHLAPVAAGVGLPLDGVALAAALSTRRLRTAYAGPCLRVRRASDGAEQDIGWAGDALDTAALLAFVGGAEGFVRTWYDQGPGGRHAAQPTASAQPRIAASGAVLTQGGRPCLRQDGSRWMALPDGTWAGSVGSTAVCAFAQNEPQAAWWRIGSTSQLVHTPWRDGNAYECYLGTERPGFGPYGPTPGGLVVHAASNNAGSLTVFRNGAPVGGAQAVGFTAAPTQRGAGDGQTAVSLSEAVFTSQALAPAARQAIERSMGAWLGVAVA